MYGMAERWMLSRSGAEERGAARCGAAHQLNQVVARRWSIIYTVLVFCAQVAARMSSLETIEDLALSWQQAALIECWEDESTSGRDSSIATFQAEIMLVCCSLTSFSLLSGSIDCFPSHSPLLLLVG